MLEILKFVFSGFWVFVGFAILFGTFCKAVVIIFGIMFKSADNIVNKIHENLD